MSIDEKKAWQHSVLDKSQTERFKKLGDLGEYIAEVQLQQKGFKLVKNLNIVKQNCMFADIYAVQDEIKYIFSVKTRNKLENNGNLNSRYKLGAKCYEYATSAEKEHDAKAAWIAVTIDTDKGIFDAYWGFLDDLKGNTGIPMSLKATKNYNCLTKNSSLNDYVDFDYKILKNKYKTRR